MGVVRPNVCLLHLASTKFEKSITSVPGYVQYKQYTMSFDEKNFLQITENDVENLQKVQRRFHEVLTDDAVALEVQMETQNQ